MSDARSFGYADPPYIGQARRHYSDDPICAEVDHGRLVKMLCDLHPDGWALSLSAPSLQYVLPMCPPDVRVLAWVKPFASFKPGVTLAYAWEPVVLRGGRLRPRAKATCRDWISENITMKKGLAGAKPERFCFWLFSVFGAQPGDRLTDWFPGTGVVGRCWARFQQGEGRDEIGGPRRA